MRLRATGALLFVVFSGCGNASPPAAASSAPPAAVPPPPTRAAPAEPASSARKRARSAAAAPAPADGTKPKNGRPLNPKDNLGRTVFVRGDDHCFVEVAPKEKPAADAPITRATELVDCPPAADDAAWDHCTAQIVLDEGGGKCFCVTGAGNPRPMPNPTPCPASAKAK